MNFPYAAIFRKAYAHCTKHPQLWVFGLYLAGIGKAALIWTAREFAESRQVDTMAALAAGKKFAARVFGVQLMASSILAVIMAALGLPVVLLVIQHEVGKAVALGILGLGILVPVGTALSFMFVYGPIFAVLYKVPGGKSLTLAFSLFQGKMRESVTMALFLAGTTLLFLLMLVFGIIVISVPAAFISLLFSLVGLAAVIEPLLYFLGFLTVCAILVLSAGCSVFQTLAWTFSVMEMVNTQKTEEPKEVLAPEAELA